MTSAKVQFTIGDKPLGAPRVYDLNKEESEPCIVGTVGCCIDHSQDNGSCEAY